MWTPVPPAGLGWNAFVSLMGSGSVLEGASLGVHGSCRRACCVFGRGGAAGGPLVGVGGGVAGAAPSRPDPGPSEVWLRCSGTLGGGPVGDRALQCDQLPVEMQGLGAWEGRSWSWSGRPCRDRPDSPGSFLQGRGGGQVEAQPLPAWGQRPLLSGQSLLGRRGWGTPSPRRTQGAGQRQSLGARFPSSTRLGPEPPVPGLRSVHSALTTALGRGASSCPPSRTGEGCGHWPCLPSPARPPARAAPCGGAVSFPVSGLGDPSSEHCGRPGRAARAPGSGAALPPRAVLGGLCASRADSASSLGPSCRGPENWCCTSLFASLASVG